MNSSRSLLAVLPVMVASWSGGSSLAGDLAPTSPDESRAKAAFLHGFCSGVLRVEGPKAAQDPGLLAGFGMVAAIFLGLPTGAVLGLILNSLRPRQGG